MILSSILPSEPRTLIFCTTFVPDEGDNYYNWKYRYRIWIEAVKRSGIKFDQMLLVDDGSRTLPDWPDVKIVKEGDDIRCDDEIVLYHFNQRLGRLDISDFPGWVRSFFFAAQYARANGFDKVIHIEADAFLLTEKAVQYVNNLESDWTAFWCERHDRPESGLQVIAGDGMRLYEEWAEKPVDWFAGKVIESTLPFTKIAEGLRGDRYTESGEKLVPRDADWCMQATPPRYITSYSSYFWWMPWLSDSLPDIAKGPTVPELIPSPSTRLAHFGVYYLDWLGAVSQILRPELYFEIGTHTGESLRRIDCDAVCVDPKFIISNDVIQGRKNTHFFQGPSDEFFDDPKVGLRHFIDGIDMAFLDGLHLYEALLRDFINTEKFMKPDGVIVLHDCLPFNIRMAERDMRLGDESEPAEIREFWTGDVWKVVPILKAYRPDLRITYFDCGPTGIVACTNLDGKSKVLSDNYGDIISRSRHSTLESYGLGKLWDLCPTFNSRQCLDNINVLSAALFGER